MKTIPIANVIKILEKEYDNSMDKCLSETIESQDRKYIGGKLNILEVLINKFKNMEKGGN